MTGSSNAQKDTYSLGFRAVLAERNLDDLYPIDDVALDEEATETSNRSQATAGHFRMRGARAWERGSQVTFGSHDALLHGDFTSYPASSVGVNFYPHLRNFWRAVFDHTTVADKLARELGRLTDGWSGEGSRAPSADVLRDVLAIMVYLPRGTRMPEVEIDPDDGSVVLRWANHDFSRSFTLTFAGRGHVTGFFASPDHRAPAWKYSTSETNLIANRLDDELISALLVG